MEKLSAEQRADLKKMSTTRLAAKLLEAGFDEEEIEGLDRAQLMEKWAICVLEGKDKPTPAVATVGGTVTDPELDKIRIQMEMMRMQLEREEKDRQDRLR